MNRYLIRFYSYLGSEYELLETTPPNTRNMFTIIHQVIKSNTKIMNI